jgi:hypothetical protein
VAIRQCAQPVTIRLCARIGTVDLNVKHACEFYVTSRPRLVTLHATVLRAAAK